MITTHKISKNKKGDSKKTVSILTYFLILSSLVFILGVCAYVYINNKIYSTEVITSLNKQSERISSSLIDSIDYSSYLMDYIGSRINSKNYKDLNYINNILSSFRLDRDVNIKIPWNMFSWVDDEMNLVVNSDRGIMYPAIPVSDRSYMNKTIFEPGKIHLGNVTTGKVSYSTIIPAGLGIVSKDGKYLGSLVFGLRLDKLTARLKSATSQDDITFAIFDYSGQQILSSQNFSMKGDTLKLIKKAVSSRETSGELMGHELFSDRSDYAFFQKIDKYSYIIVTKYDSNSIISQDIKLYSISAETLSAIGFIALIFFFLKIFIIRPISQLSYNSQIISQNKNDKITDVESHITEIANLAEQINKIKKYKDELIEARDSKERFFANMSHELRTPLNGIINCSVMIKDEMFGELNKDYREIAADISSSAIHLSGLINDILDFSKITFGKMNLVESHFNVEEVVKEVVTVAINLARTQGLSLSVKHSISSDISRFFGDQKIFRQILLNLLSNAVKFSSNRDIEVRLAKNSAQELVIEVEDHGVGIRQEDLPKLLIEFGQISDGYSRNKMQGTGLGLFLVKRMVELHHGRFELNSVYGRGTIARTIYPKSRTI